MSKKSTTLPEGWTISAFAAYDYPSDLWICIDTPNKGQFLKLCTKPHERSMAVDLMRHADGVQGTHAPDAAQRLDALLTQVLNRRVTIEQRMLDAASGKRAMPTADELRQWALELGTPADCVNAPPLDEIPDAELPGMWERADFTGGQDEVRGSAGNAGVPSGCIASAETSNKDTK